MSMPETLNARYIESQYALWKKNPESVPSDWHHFFQGFEIGLQQTPVDGDAPAGLAQARVEALKYRYRDLGHLLACMDPLSACPVSHPLLELTAFSLAPEDLDRPFYTRRFGRDGTAILRDIVGALRETYCRSIGVEYMHLQDPAERQWLQDQMEPVRNQPPVSAADRGRILEQLVTATLFEQFLNKKYVGVTRFSIEGAEGLIPFLDMLVRQLSAAGTREVILGMAHRGRLNVQAHILKRPYEDIFSEFEHCYDPSQLVGAGDVKYHNGYLADFTTPEGRPVRMLLVNNPSHLEAVDPVVEGIARARQELMKDGAEGQVTPVLLHGDAAFAGQGVVAEVFNMSQLAGYRTGGTVHVVINNQIGYTTLPEDARSTRYATDVAKMIMAPVFHVHGENPESLIHVARLAADYRARYHKDVVVDIICYRRYGHNEGDEPYFTQPLMYRQIQERPPAYRLYADRLAAEDALPPEPVSAMENSVNETLEKAYAEVHDSVCTFPESRYFEEWNGLHGNIDDTPVDTGVDAARLTAMAEALNRVPDGFALNRKLAALLKRRMSAVSQGVDIDWANAEALAFASLLTEGTPIRLSGQDVGRGTFSQRHSVLFDTDTGATHVPLNTLPDGAAAYRVHNSLLAEVSVLGFEYGYAVTRPDVLTLWEAQFGDFVNNAQTVIDLFITAGESKWQRLCGLVMLLPHGWEGMGPEHSSARLERFLQLCAEDNIQVCYPTTPAQYFHLLRRQIHRQARKPLVVMTPKSLLRHPRAVSTLADLSAGGFQEVIDDAGKGAAVDTVLLCSGKIYYELSQRQVELGKPRTRIIRLEQFFPFPENRLKPLVKKYARAKHWLWVQEEPRNMGGWSFVRPHLETLIGKPLTYIGRPPAASPATGFPAIYKRDQAAITDTAVGPQSPDAHVTK
ncbi:MAG: 2-oxoglutarate dehydrogenase E1 component [Pseudomonadota bacterium]